jgi:hypothetical protein
MIKIPDRVRRTCANDTEADPGAVRCPGVRELRRASSPQAGRQRVPGGDRERLDGIHRERVVKFPPAVAVTLW